MKLLIVILTLFLSGCAPTVIDAIVRDGDTGGMDTSFGTDVEDSEISSDTDDKDTLDSESIDTDSFETDTFVDSAVFGLTGFGAVSAMGQDGTTGGGFASPVVVTNGEEMQDAIDNKGSEPIVINVNGRITHTIGRVLLSNVSDISIVGTGPDAELDGFGISLSGASNIIIKNLTIHHVADLDQDAIRITDQSHHIWVDHCLFYNDAREPLSTPLYDSLLDVSHGSDYITVSWSHFRDHVKTMYIGHSDDNEAEDTGTLNTTWHHNVFTNISPIVLSVRFGTAHMFNNRFKEIPYVGDGTGIGISSRMEACVRLEHNEFVDLFEPVITNQSGMDAVSLGSVEQIDNVITNATNLNTTPTCTQTVSYTYKNTLNNPADLEEILGQNVGPR